MQARQCICLVWAMASTSRVMPTMCTASGGRRSDVELLIQKKACLQTCCAVHACTSLMHSSSSIFVALFQFPVVCCSDFPVQFPVALFQSTALDDGRPQADRSNSINPGQLAVHPMLMCGCNTRRLGEPEALPKAAALAVKGMREGGRRRVLLPPQGGWVTERTQVAAAYLS